MRVVQAAGWYLPDSIGGTELYVAALASRLRRAGHDVAVTAPDVGAAHAREYEHEGVPVYRYPIPADVTRDEARGRVAVRGASALHQWLAARRPDVVHAHTFVTGLGLMELEAARDAGARVVVTCHSARLGFVCERGTMMRGGRTLCDGVAEPVKCAACALEARGVPAPVATLLARTPPPLSRAARAVPGPVGTALALRAFVDDSRAAQRRLFELADAVVVLSEWAAEALRGNGAPASKVIVNRLGIARGAPGPVRAGRDPHAPLTVGFVGRAEPIKGLDDAVRAVVSLPASTAIRLRAVVVAAGEAERAELARCRDLAAGDPRVVFEPAVAPADVAALLASLDLLVCPSRVVEGGPTVALEAHAAGTPVVGAAVPALTEFVVDDVNGRLHTAGDWRALARILASVVDDPTATVDAWRTALARPRTMDDIAGEYLELYARVA